MAKPTIFRFPLIRFPLDEFCREVDDRFSLSVRVGELSYNSAHFVTPKTLVPSLAVSLSLSLVAWGSCCLKVGQLVSILVSSSFFV